MKTELNTMNTKQKHSPTPWKINRFSDSTGDSSDTRISSVTATNGQTIVFTDSGYFKPLESDMQILVHCVNSHEQMSEDLARTVKQKDELLESLKDIISLFNSCDDSVCEMFDLTQKGLDLHLDDARKCISQIESEGVN